MVAYFLRGGDYTDAAFFFDALIGSCAHVCCVDFWGQPGDAMSVAKSGDGSVLVNAGILVAKGGFGTLVRAAGHNQNPAIRALEQFPHMFALLFGRAGVHAVLDCQINIPDQKRVRRLPNGFGNKVEVRIDRHLNTLLTVTHVGYG